MSIKKYPLSSEIVENELDSEIKDISVPGTPVLVELIDWIEREYATSSKYSSMVTVPDTVELEEELEGLEGLSPHPTDKIVNTTKKNMRTLTLN